VQVLFVTCHLPYPAVSGGRLRELELLRRLAGEVDVHLCAVSKTYDEDRLAADRLRGLCASVEVFEAQRGSSELPAQLRRHCSREAMRYLEPMLGEVDLAHVEGFYLLHLLPTRSPVPVLLVEQNVEHSLWEQRVAIADGNRRQREAFREFRETRAAEVAAWQRADLCAAVTDEDRAAILRIAPALDVRIVPDGADHLGGPPAGRTKPRHELVFVGNFAYHPNADAALWFCREILPLVRERAPGVVAYLVGNDPPPEVRELAGDDVVVTGRVRSVERYLDRAAVVVAPLRVGGGIKVKVLEALHRGKALVSTSVGVQGLGEDVGRSVEVADDPARFADACSRLLLDAPARRSLERRALAFAGTLPTWDKAAAQLLGCYRELALSQTLADAEGAELR
jgi:polysaccharide biosynthesis protein PslH